MKEALVMAVIMAVFATASYADSMQLARRGHKSSKIGYSETINPIATLERRHKH